MSRAKSAIARLLGTTDPEVIKKVREVAKKQATERDHTEASDATTYKTSPIQVVPKEYDQAKAEAEAKAEEQAQEEALFHSYVMSPEWKEQYVDQETKAEDAKHKQIADNYNAMSKLEDTFAAYEQSQDVAELFPGAKSESSTTWRDRVAQRKEGEAQAKAKVDQERKELRQRMQLLKDNPDAWEKSLEQPLQTNAPEVGLRSMESFANGKPVDKRGNVHDNWVSQAQANQRIDAENKARQLGMQADEIQDMLADPMALEKTMREVEAEIERLGKARDAAAQKYGSEHPFLSLLSGAKGTRSLDPWLEGAYGPEAQSITLELEKAFAKLDNLKNIEKKIKSGELSRGGFWNGVGQMGQAVADKVTDRSWGMYEGMSNMLSESEKQIVFDKIAKGEPLTASEMQWATIDLLEGKVNTEVDSPYLYNITSGLMESAPYMRDIFLSPGKGISGAFVNWGKSRYGATGFLKLVGNALQGAATTATVGADELVSGTSERMRGDLSFGENGLEVTGQKSLGRALTQQFASQTASNMVELMGVPLLDKAGKYIGKAVKEVADGLSYGKVSKVLSAMDKSSAVNWVNGVRKSMGIHSLPAEIGEEYVDGFAQSIVEGEDQLSPMLNTEEFLNIAGTCGLMSAIFGSANVAGFAGEFHKVNREFKKAKQEVLRQFSSDVWASLDNLITNAQDEDLTVRLADAMDGMAMNREQRSAIMNYLTALKRYQKFNELNDGGKFIIGGPQQAQATQSTSTSTYEIDSDITLKDEIGNPIDAHIIGRDANGNYMVESSQPINGKRVQPMSADQLDAMVIPNTPDGIQQSEVDGYNLTDANQQAEVSMLTDNARESVATLLGVTPDAVDVTLQQALGDNPTDAKIDARFGDNAQVVKDYMYNVAKTKGMSARLIDDIADATAESDRAIDEVDNNGNVITAKDVNGNDVNVVSGNIVTYEDGLIDTNNSDSSVVIRHADGSTEMVAPTSLTEVVSMPTEQAKATQAQAIAQQMQQAFSDKLNGVLDYSQGQQYTMLNADGSTTDVTILADNGDGNVTVTARDGNKEGGVTDGKQIVLPKSQIQQGVREFKRNQLRGESAQQTSIPQAEVQPTEVAEPTQEPSMPTDEQGNIMYEQMDADSAWDALLAETGGDADMAMTVANEMIADKTKAVEEASKMTPEVGTTPQEKIANLKAVKQAQAQAQAELDAWKAIAETPTRRMSLQAEQVDLQTEQTDLQTDLQTESTPTESESTPQVGLVEDARTHTLGDKTRKMLDEMAQRLGLQVEFVDEVKGGKANADIVGNKVRIAWDKRDQALDFLLGHEFTHRMQDLSPEAYAEFVEATKQALGEEEWNKRINRMKSLYRQHGINISEQGIIDEVVADYAGELVEERGVFDNFVERNKNNRSLLSKIADVLKSIKEFFTLGKQRKIDNAIARLEALIESASEANLRGDVVNMEKDRYSVSSIFEGSGAIVFNEEGGANIDKDGNFYVIINGKQYDGNNLITLDDIKADKRSVLNMMVEDAIKEGNVTEEHADVIMKKYVDIMNMFLVEGLAENGGYANMADKWMWVGETVYKTVQPNSDKQYTKSIDITTVCKKNEAVIRAMSEMQKRVGYGITPAQILDIYIETQQSGYQVPCPVCYVFSRYLRNGKYASGAILGMEQYGEHLPGGSGETWTADQWVAELRRLEEIDEDKTNKALYNQASADIVEAETMIDKLGLRLQQSNSEAERKELRKQIEKADARYRAALNIFSQSALTSWIKTFAIQGSDDKGYKMRDDAQYPEDIELFKEHALDLRKAGETQTLFPAIQRLRNSGGSSTGKAVGFESNNALGDVISGIATGNNDTAYARASKATTEKEFQTNRKKATENFKKASEYIKQQTLRGGQRMWSWSDNIEALMPDVVINLMQLELLGGALQTYSKQLEGVNLVARMGGYVNGSLMAKDNGYTEVTEDMIKVEDGKEVLAEDITETIQEPIVGRGIVDRTRVLAQAGSPVIEVDGKKYVLIFDDVIGIDPHGREVDGVHMKGLFDLNKELSKAGNIIVGMNDTHIRVGLADSRIYFIIPWHASGANNHILTEMFRVLGADISSMASTDYTDMQSEKDYLKEKKDGSMPKIEQSVRDIWNAHKNETDWKCGVKGGIDSSKETISDSQKHYRELRQAIFDGELINNKAWLREVQADEFLSQVYDRVQSGTIGNSMTQEDNNHIYPYEYWDTSKTYDEADINGERYIEYCRRLGFSPKFSGIHGKKEYKNTGNFTNDKGYWKLLVDRRMYDIHGRFQDLDPVTSEDYTNELVHPGNTNKEFVISEVADAKATNKIVDRVIEKEVARTGTMPTVDYGMSHEDVYKNYKPEYDVLKADEVQAKAETKLAEAKQKLDTLVANGATKGRITTATKNVAKAEEALQQAKKAATSAEKEAQKSRFSLTNLTEEEQRIVDEAKANGTYLKAPNGKASNLNERQWIQVRTKAFKDWFGDWENNPENASKVVDENGEPMAVYHGTAIGGFSIFGKASKGIYFTDSRKAIDDYAWNGNKDVDNYFPFDPFADNQLDIVNKWLSEKDRGMMPKGTQVKEENGGWRIYLPDGTGLSTNFDSETMMMLLMEYATKDNPEFEGKGVYSTHLNMKNPFVIDAESKSWSDLPKTINGVTIPEKYMVVHQKQTVSTDEWAEFLQSEEGRKLGFDGMIVNNVYDSHTADGTITDYIAFEPTQIKSATDNVGTFDTSNPDIRYSLFGGNSGYVGYSMSKRAARARAEGRYPKTDFKKEYSVTAKSFEELVDAKIIVSGEWHHTSMYGNETKFYHWDKDFYADIYEENKKQIDKLSRERKTNEIISLFENHPLELKAEYDNETEWLVRDVNREYSNKIREVENEKRDKEGAYNSAVFDALGQLTNVVKANNGNLWFNASNGVGIQIDSAGNEKSMNYSNTNEGNSRDALRAEARNELQTAIENIVKEGNIESVDATYYTDKVNQLEAERAERVAQLVEAREKEYTEQTDLEGDYGGERYSLVTDPATIEMLESAPKVSDSGVKLYRAMIEIDGKLYPPMSSMVEENGEKVLREGINIGDWVKSDEDLSKAILKEGKDGYGYYFRLLKDDGSYVDARYNPYLHTSDSMLNDQFKSAQSRPNLVVVEMEIPITGDYKAEGAKDAVGFVPGGWKSGDVATQLPTTRNVYLSQYGKPVRIVPTEEVAQHIYDRINGYVDVMPSNVVTPQVREALEKMGVQFVETDNQSVILEGKHKGKQWTHVYGKETIRKREEKSAKANAWVETTKQRLANAEAGLQKAKDNVAKLEQTEAEGMIGKAVGSAIEKAKEKVAKAEAKVAKAKATHEKAKSKVEPRYASRYSLQNLDDIPVLSNKEILSNGVTVYDIAQGAYEDGVFEGQLWLREIVDAHLGKDANPWNVIDMDADGEPTTQNSNEWAFGLVKKVAFQNGKIIAYNDGHEWIDTQQQFHKRIPFFKERDGKTYVYTNNGFADNLSYAFKGNASNGMLEIYRDGYELTERMHFKDGKLHGLYEYFYANGNLENRANYLNGKTDGLSEYFYPDGKPKEKTEVKQGKKHGISEKYDNHGNLVSKVKWNNGIKQFDYGVNRWGIEESKDVDLNTITEMFNQWNSDKDLSALYQKVEAIASTIPLKIQFVPMSALGLYYMLEGKIEYNSKLLKAEMPMQEKAHVILHELIHSVVFHAIKTYEDGGQLSSEQENAVESLERVFEQIVADKEFADFYGITNLQEMVAELSDVEFRNALRKKDLWSTIVEAIKRLLGIRPDNALDGAERALDSLLGNFDKNEWNSFMSTERAKSEKRPKYSLQGGRSIADKYEKKVNTKGKGGAIHLSKFNFMEAWQDEMRALKEVQRLIEQEYGIVLESYEDAYMAENAMSSIAKASWDRYIKEVYEPMMRIHDEWIRSGESNESINHYLIAKSGLERNRELMVRDALAEMNKMDAQIINGEYSGTVLRLANALRQGQISQDEYDAQVQEAKNKKAQALEDVKSVQQGRVDAYRAERDALREQLKNGDIAYEEFNQLSDEVAIRHAKVEEIKDYSGLTALAKAHGRNDWQLFTQGMVTAFEAKHSNTDVMWEHINNNTKSAVDYSYKSGVTSKQAKDHLDQMFLWYVPMKGNADVEAEDIYTYVNDKSSSFTPTVKGAKGHSEYVSEDVMALIANTMQSAILQGERNKVKQKFLNMVENYPTDLFTLDRGWVVMQGNEWVESHPEIKADYTAEQIREAIEKHDAEMQELAEQGLAMSKEGALRLGVPFRATQNEQEHAISVMRNGEKVTIYVNGNPRVAQAVNGKLKATPAWGLYETWKRWFSASKTSYSPNFIVSNASRDTGHTAMMTFVQRGLKEQLKALGTYIPAYATLVANAVGKKSPIGYKYDQYLEEFVSNGGVTGYSQLYGVDKFKTDNAKRIARLKGAAKALQQGVNVVENINEVWQNINGIFENSSRFNEYIRSRDRGEDVATSVFNAKNITVNFNKKGGGAVEDSMFHQLAFVGRNWIPFFNPIVQGIYQFLKVGKEHKGRMALACLGFMGGGFLAPILNAMLVGALGGDDEDDYMKQPEWTRRNNFMIYTGDGYAKFALPQMFRELYGIGDILYCAVKGNMSAEDAAMQVVSQLRNMFSLEGQSSQKGKEWDALRFLAPDYFGAVVDIETNTNFTGAPLWKETDYNQFDPDYKKAYNNTWSWLVDFSQKVNEWTGGDEYSKGNVNNKYLTNPAVWQRLITEMGGGLTETIGDVYNTAYSLLTGQDIDKSNIPLVKRLYTETNDETLQKWIDREYYSLEGTHKYVKNRMSKLNKSSALDTADKISMMYYDRDYMVYAIYETYSKEIKELRDQAQSAPEDKKAEIQKREYDAKMKVISLIDNFNAIEDKEVETYMANNPMVARLVGKDIIKKVGAKYKELKRNWKEAPYGSPEEKKASDAVNAFEKTPEYQYYDSIRMATKAIDKKEEEIDTVLLPKNRLKIKAEIDSIKTQLVELRKAYESIGEVKE